MHPPIIITGCARSGTSLTCGVLAACGVQFGETIGATPANPKGQWENRAIISEIQKPYLNRVGVDPLGQYPLPDPKALPRDSGRRERVLDIAAEQGIDTDKPWAFKDAKALLDWQVWAKAFPDAVWVVTHRPAGEIARSCLRTPFMRAYSTEAGWREWVGEHEMRIRALLAHCNGYRVHTPAIAAGNEDVIRPMVKRLGLKYQRKRIMDWIDQELWHGA